MTEPIVIDTNMHGYAGITAAFLLQGELTALIETGPKSSVDHVITGLDRAGVDGLDFIIVTHIHLDHAGAAGTLVRRFPDATVAVHPVGAPHLIDPSKLWASAGRIYGKAMDELWGGIDPVPDDRVRVIEDGEIIDLGDRTLRAVETQGHAYHHHAFLDEAADAIYVGDALGVRLAGTGKVRPATPPPEFHLEKAIESIHRIRSLDPQVMYLTHFSRHDDGPPASAGQVCDEAVAALQQWAGWVRTARAEGADVERAVARVRAEARAAAEAGMPPDIADRLDHTTSYEMNVAGYMRYMDKAEASK
ncbi:MAG TPA: MBL fold metallo-hydrolase [Actinomycetota bacterium]|nr:MBL fold metallo-hydrolase [Actinomycetota bacterium]